MYGKLSYLSNFSRWEDRIQIRFVVEGRIRIRIKVTSKIRIRIIFIYKGCARVKELVQPPQCDYRAREK
jgi:hypothetical protein